MAEFSCNNASIAENIKQMYQLENILVRPDTYIGSIEKHTQTLWVYEDEQMVQKPITFVPGLYKIFDEILVNAANNKQRNPKMDSVKVNIDVESNCISVYNNGCGIPVEIHQGEGVYVPEMIFGHLLTSSNYDDNEKKTTGGRNEYGAKLTNIFSTEFVIETADGTRQKKYKQIFSNNMGTRSEPIISKCRASENWTKITFKPDLAKFSMTCLEEDVVALMKKRAIDVAGCLGKTVKVELNGQLFRFKKFSSYCELYLKSSSVSSLEPLPGLEGTVHGRWQIFINKSEGQFQQVSFVNGIATVKGGTHVDYVTNKITSHLVNVLKDRNENNKMFDIKPHTVKNHLWVFVNALIDNPAFDSQTKETLTLPASFGWDFTSKFLDSVSRSFIKNIEWAEFKQKKNLKNTDGAKDRQIYGLTRLADANEAGGKNSDKCTLILTEGDSAKALAIAGLAVVGRDYYGVFPLRGKLLNVREARHKQLMENAEIQHIEQIMGLQHGKHHDSVKSLRYGHLMIMTDQDHDGSHLKGLLINFIHYFWPSLLKVPRFLSEFITPIIKAFRNDGKEKLSFYTMPQYESWKEAQGTDTEKWTIKYYKGLGTSTNQEGKEYFSDLGKHKKDFVWVDGEDDKAIELAFSKKEVEARKNWLRQFDPGTFLGDVDNPIKYCDFIHKELILHSMADIQMSIPSMVDGLKPGQRKILYCSFKKNLIIEMKVAQFTGYVSEHSAYHHGENNLAGTIIGMAQDYVGSNNINLLLPNGQFGTRGKGGKDHASARYIFTKLAPVTRSLFHKDDDILLNNLFEDGQKIEPSWYVPIIPMVLVNGSEGIGTGWSTYVPNYNPLDIIKNIRHLLNDEPMEPMHPWYKGFIGSIERSETKGANCTYTASGIIEEVDETTLRITELPIRKWTEDYKEFLESVSAENDESKDPFIESCRDNSGGEIVHFTVRMSNEQLLAAREEDLHKKFKLTTSICTTNMHLFDSNGVIKKYDSPEQILEEFFHLRLEFYNKRKKAMLANKENEVLKCENKYKFIQSVVEGSIIVSNRKKADLYIELKEKGFTPFSNKKNATEVVIAGATDDVEETEDIPEVDFGKGVSSTDYDYLLSMSIGTLTVEKMQELREERHNLLGELDKLKQSSVKSLWIKDLGELEKKLSDNTTAEAGSEVKKPRAKAPAVKKKVTVVDEEDDELSDLREGTAANNFDSFPDRSEEMESEPVQTKKPANRRAAAPKKSEATLTEIDEEDAEDAVSYYDFQPEEKITKMQNLCNEMTSKDLAELEKKLSDNTTAEVGKIGEVKKPRAKTSDKTKAPAVKKRTTLVDEEEDDGIYDLREGTANNFDSSPDRSEDMESEPVQTKKPANRRTAAHKKTKSTLTEIDEKDAEDIMIISEKPANRRAAAHKKTKATLTEIDEKDAEDIMIISEKPANRQSAAHKKTKATLTEIDEKDAEDIMIISEKPANRRAAAHKKTKATLTEIDEKDAEDIMIISEKPANSRAAAHKKTKATLTEIDEKDAEDIMIISEKPANRQSAAHKKTKATLTEIDEKDAEDIMIISEKPANRRAAAHKKAKATLTEIDEKDAEDIMIISEKPANRQSAAHKKTKATLTEIDEKDAEDIMIISEKPANRRAAAHKKTKATLTEIDEKDAEDIMIISDDDFQPEENIEKMQAWQNKIHNLMDQLEKLKQSSVKSLWKEDHVELEKKLSDTTTAEAGSEVKKPRAKAPAVKKKVTVVDEEDDELSDLREGTAANNFDSFPDRSEEMESEPVQTKKPANRRAAAPKKSEATLTEIDEEDAEDAVSYYDFQPEEKITKMQNLCNEMTSKDLAELEKKLSDNTTAEVGKIGEVKKPRAKTSDKTKAPAVKKRTTLVDEEEDDGIYDLREGTANNFDSSPDRSEVLEEFYNERKKGMLANTETKADLYIELKKKGFTPFPNKTNATEVDFVKGVSSTDYDYLLSMSIGTLTVEMKQAMCDEHTLLDELTQSSVKSFWIKDPVELEKKLSDNTTAEAGKIGEVKKPRTKTSAKTKAPAVKKRTTLVDEEEDDGIYDLREGTANNFDSSPDRSEVMESEPVQTKKPANRRAAAPKKSNVDDAMIISDDDSQPEEKITKGGRKPANAKAAAKPPAGAKKIGPASKQSGLVGQKLITEVLKPAERMRASESSSVSNASEVCVTTDDSESDADDDDDSDFEADESDFEADESDFDGDE